MSENSSDKTDVVHKNNSFATPLTIISGFTSIICITMSVALVKTSGGVQIAVLVFLFLFAFFVAIMFFVTLWRRPVVLYSPSDYGGSDPKEFMGSLQNFLSPNQRTLIKTMEVDPNNKEAKFAQLEDSVLELPPPCPSWGSNFERRRRESRKWCRQWGHR